MLQLRPDSRASLNAVPPSYSKALVAPVPSCVVEIEDAVDDKFPERQQSSVEPDAESHRLVMIDCDPPPPTYVEALEYVLIVKERSLFPPTAKLRRNH